MSHFTEGPNEFRTPVVSRDEKVFGKVWFPAVCYPEFDLDPCPHVPTFPDPDHMMKEKERPGEVIIMIIFG